MVGKLEFGMCVCIMMEDELFDCTELQFRLPCGRRVSAKWNGPDLSAAKVLIRMLGICLSALSTTKIMSSLLG